MPRLTIHRDEISPWDGKVRVQVNERFVTTKPLALTVTEGVLTIDAEPEDGGVAFLIPLHALRLAKYEPDWTPDEADDAEG